MHFGYRIIIIFDITGVTSAYRIIYSMDMISIQFIYFPCRNIPKERLDISHHSYFYVMIPIKIPMLLQQHWFRLCLYAQRLNKQRKHFIRAVTWYRVGLRQTDT